MTISGHARVACVIGWPVAHSLSPRLHGWWLRHYRIDGAYVPAEVAPERLAGALSALAVLGFAGANLTVPHKEAAVDLVEADALARRVGAVNTVIVGAGGRLSGTNTDVFGFTESLRLEAPALSPASGPAVVIGAGGAARAVVVALFDLGVPAIRLVNRGRERAESLAEALGGPVTVVAWNDRGRALDQVGLLVNATTQGMVGQMPLDLDLDRLPPTAVVADLVYSPLITPLLETARTRGNPIVTGLGMLLHQARPGFKAWFGVEPEVLPALRAFVAQAPGG